MRIIDGPLLHLNRTRLVRILEEYCPDVVGFQLLTMDFAVVWRYITLVKEFFPTMITLVGGPQPSSEPEGTLHWFGPSLDYAFAGESEEGFSMLLDVIEGSTEHRPPTKYLSEIPGLVWRDGARARSNAPRRELNLDALGFPAWDMINPSSYPPAPHAAYARAFPVGCISASRGCPYDCNFCAASITQGKKLRTRSVEHVLEEIEMLVRHYGMKEIHLVDDNFTYYRDYAMRFCEQKSRRFPEIYWTCPNGVRLDSLDLELLDAMRRSGCYSLSLGIESGSQRVLDRARKRQTIEQVREKVELIRKAGMEVNGFFIFGMPGESLEDMQATIRLSLELDLTRSHYMFFHPMPATSEYKRIISECPECLRHVESSLERVAYVEKGLTEKTLKHMQRSAFLRFYLRPAQFFKLFSSLRSPTQIYYLMRRISRWMVFS